MADKKITIKSFADNLTKPMMGFDIYPTFFHQRLFIDNLRSMFKD
jgi:hypothetical protein